MAILATTENNGFKVTAEDYKLMEEGLENFINLCHGSSEAAGWYKKEREYIDRGFPSMYIISTKMLLVISEITEAMEGLRKNLMDDKLPHKKMVGVEFGDALIRLADLAGFIKSLPEYSEVNVAEDTAEKFHYNQSREDHKFDNRMKEGGKAF